MGLTIFDLEDDPSASTEPIVVLREERKKERTFDFSQLNNPKPKFERLKRVVSVSSEVTKKAASDELKMYCPANLDIEELLEANPPQFSIGIDKIERADKFRYIINLICTLPVYQRELWELNDYGEVDDIIPFVPLNSQKLKSVIRNYQYYLRYLVENEVLECDNKYVFGVKSKGYRFCEQYLSEAFIANGITNEKVLGALLRDKQERDRLALEAYPQLRAWLDQLDFDCDGALAELMDRKPWCNPYERLALERIRDNDWFFRLDNTAGRLHTNLTNLSKHSRPYLTYKGKRLMDLDVANAQPYLAARLLQPDFYAEPIDGTTVINIKDIFGKQTLFGAKNQLYEEVFEPMLQFLRYKVAYHKTEIGKYIEWVAEGMFYEKCAGAFNIETNSVTFDRAQMKKNMYVVYYGRNQSSNDFKRIFKRIFPFVCRVFSSLKKKDHCYLPILLQAIEAHIVLDRIVGRITRERPDVFLVTIHDCVATIPEYVEYVHSLMYEEFVKAVGLPPTLKRECWE